MIRVYSQPTARWWRRRACYECFSLVIPFCTCFLPRRRDKGEREREFQAQLQGLSAEVISRSEASAGTEDIRSVQGQADKDKTASPCTFHPTSLTQTQRICLQEGSTDLLSQPTCVIRSVGHITTRDITSHPPSDFSK